MVLRIEYVLLLAVALVFGVLLFQKPSDISAIESNSSKELTFKNFSLIEVTETGVSNQLVSSQAVKYKSHFELDDINISYQKNHHLLAKKAIYRDDFIYLNDDIILKRDDGIAFTTQKLEYSLKDKNIHTTNEFQIDINESSVKGENLRYDFKQKSVSADKIHAKIVFEDSNGSFME
ncbi:MAG: LPS export ABC transporter periplasmic protein LptC [Epsilonproteobacteria bacterium]|nr:LPS export ABC transporter periplasmic protein LptC [Campylobacterota bacterium]